MTRAVVLTLVLLSAATAGAQKTAQPDKRPRLFPPTELGLLEGPDRDAWQRPDQIMDALQIGESSVVADLGAGGGWFTVRLAQRVRPNGLVYAEDIQPQMIQAIERRVQREGFAKNVITVRGTADDPRLPGGTLDAVLIVDAYHEIERPITLLTNVRASLKPTGVVAIINSKKDGGGPGPTMDERIDPETVIADAAAAGLELRKRENFLRYQYMLTFGPAASAR
ncbi:MAG TPA: class I SAM-dependent methyltransferase [Vicinamibacterales bacterium]|jgi:predicted methyltransferase